MKPAHLPLALTASLAALTTPAAASGNQKSPPPNIVYILADDLGWGDVGYNQGPIPTPNIDRLTREGVIIDQHYVALMCTPTRAALMTGRYWSRYGVYRVQAGQTLPFNTFTLPHALNTAGYNTALIGKWHVGSKPEWGPNHYGFDYSYGSLGGGVCPCDHRYKECIYSHTWHRNCELITEEGHVTDLLGNEAVKYITQNNGACTGTENNDTDYPAGQDYAPGGIPGSTHPLRGWKAMIYDGGIRTPAFVNWPGVLAPRTMTQPVSITDWMPTFATMLNIRPPKKRQSGTALTSGPLSPVKKSPIKTAPSTPR